MAEIILRNGSKILVADEKVVEIVKSLFWREFGLKGLKKGGWRAKRRKRGNCVVCGNPLPKRRSVACSVACWKELARRRAKEWYVTHKEEINRRRKEKAGVKRIEVRKIV